MDGICLPPLISVFHSAFTHCSHEMSNGNAPFIYWTSIIDDAMIEEKIKMTGYVRLTPVPWRSDNSHVEYENTLVMF